MYCAAGFVAGASAEILGAGPFLLHLSKYPQPVLALLVLLTAGSIIPIVKGTEGGYLKSLRETYTIPGVDLPAAWLYSCSPVLEYTSCTAIRCPSLTGLRLLCFSKEKTPWIGTSCVCERVACMYRADNWGTLECLVPWPAVKSNTLPAVWKATALLMCCALLFTA